MVMSLCFKQKTAYEMRISDWSSDVCSSDLQLYRRSPSWVQLPQRLRGSPTATRPTASPAIVAISLLSRSIRPRDRKSVVQGQSVSVRVDIGGRRIIKQNTIEVLINTDRPHIHTVRHRYT